MTDTDGKCIVNAYYLQKNGSPRLNYAQYDAYKVVLLNGAAVWWIYEPSEGITHFYIDTMVNIHLTPGVKIYLCLNIRTIH